MKSYVVKFYNRAAKDAKEINVLFEGSEQRHFAKKTATFMKKQQIYTNKTGAFATKKKECENLQEKNIFVTHIYNTTPRSCHITFLA